MNEKEFLGKALDLVKNPTLNHFFPELMGKISSLAQNLNEAMLGGHSAKNITVTDHAADSYFPGIDQIQSLQDKQDKLAVNKNKESPTIPIDQYNVKAEKAAISKKLQNLDNLLDKKCRERRLPTPESRSPSRD